MDQRLSSQCSRDGLVPEKQGETGDGANCVLLVIHPSSLPERRKEEERAMTTTTEQAWEAFHAPLYQFIRRRVADEATAEDLLQEVFLKIHQQGASLRDARRLESWIYQITRNLIIDSYRSHRQPMASLDVEEAIDLPEELSDDDIVSELLPCVRAMVLALPDQDRQALILTQYQGLTQKELGERLGLSFSGAKSRVQRAREKLKQELLACCHFELDRRGHILDYYPHCDCCEQSAGCSETHPKTNCQVRPFSPNSVSSNKSKREGRSALLVVLNGKEPAR
jgi:RNA polymerase sigma-70 factor (ECF subfamily)